MELECNCGYKVSDSDAYMVQGKMWHHSLHSHNEMLKGMSEQELAGILKDHAKKTGLEKK